MSGSLVRGEGCSAPLGLQSGLIPDSALTSSLAASSPEHARLHHPASAWCFLYSEVKSRGRGDVLLEIDLGQPRLVSGFQSQGPPEALHPPDYMRYISLGLEVSTEAGQWADCCSGDTGGRTTFYADDKSGEAGVVRTHAFPALVAARRLRVRISTALRWIGHDHKCFRFEVLGCSAASEANSSLAAAALAPGYISVWWRQPRLGTQQLHSAFFLLNVTEVGGAGGGVTILNTTDTSTNLATPSWGAEYLLSLTCWLHGVPLRCGAAQLTALAAPSPACRAHSSFCSAAEDAVVFLSPEQLTASRNPDTGAVTLRQGRYGLGWVGAWVRVMGGWGVAVSKSTV